MLALAACTVSPPAPPTPQPFTAPHVVKLGPYPLYERYGEWLANRVSDIALAEADDRTMEAGRLARVQNRSLPTDGPWLHSGCIFDVEGTTADQQEPGYLWAYGRVVRCDELISTGLLEPQMGVRPRELRIYDGRPGYFPMSLLEPYTGSLPAPRN
jgi:hypothetical protein